MSGLVIVTAGPASAAPAPLAAPGDNGDDGEGGSKSLIEQLEAASKGFVEAKEALDRSKKRQVQLTELLKTIDAELAPRQDALDQIAQQTYRTGRLGPMTALLTASSTGSLLDRAQTLETVAVKQDQALRELKDTRAKQEQAKLAVDASIREQQKQLTVMAKRKAQAENALKAANQGGDAGGSSSGGSSSQAAAARRNSDGSLPSEGCSVNDPTTSGCITPRLLNAYQQARAAGFKRYASCFSQRSSGEHPKGRACDHAAATGGFENVNASGGDRTYGNNLAAFFVKNANRLGVMYVIWYRQIWMPGTGWRSYSGSGGPSAAHTNHVHLSVL
jgi:peptidoglycan DL-endopeptidase CwlO